MNLRRVFWAVFYLSGYSQQLFLIDYQVIKKDRVAINQERGKRILWLLDPQRTLGDGSLVVKSQKKFL